MNKNCLLFASWLPIGKEHRIDTYIDLLNTRFSSFDIFVGINGGSSPRWKEELVSRVRNIVFIEDVTPDMVVNSDASAYQTALKGLKNSGNQYKNVYFIHTKGMSYQDSKASNWNWPASFEQYTIGISSRIEAIEKILEEDRWGGWSQYGGIYQPPGTTETMVDKFYTKPTKFSGTGVLWCVTNYAIKYHIVKEFIDNCGNFLNTRLDRYFFEFWFPLIIDTQGYEKYVEEWWIFPWEYHHTTLRYNYMIERWKKNIKGVTNNCDHHLIMKQLHDEICLCCGKQRSVFMDNADIRNELYTTWERIDWKTK